MRKQPKGRQRRLQVAELNIRQERFLVAYQGPASGNATQAAILAGYSKRTAYSHGARLLKHVEIQRRLQSAAVARAASMEITASRVLEEIRRLALSDIRNLFDEQGKLKAPQDWDAEAAAAVAGFEVARTKVSTRGKTRVEESIVKIRSWDKSRNLETLAKYLGLLKDEPPTPPPPVQVNILAGLPVPMLRQIAEATTNGNGHVESDKQHDS